MLHAFPQSAALADELARNVRPLRELPVSDAKTEASSTSTRWFLRSGASGAAMPVVEKLAAVRRYRVGVPGLQSRRQCEAREGRALHGRVTIRARQVDHARQVGVCGTVVATWSEKPVVAQVGDRVCGEVDKRVPRVLRR